MPSQQKAINNKQRLSIKQATCWNNAGCNRPRKNNQWREQGYGADNQPNVDAALILFRPRVGKALALLNGCGARHFFFLGAAARAHTFADCRPPCHITRTGVCVQIGFGGSGSGFVAHKFATGGGGRICDGELFGS